MYIILYTDLRVYITVIYTLLHFITYISHRYEMTKTCFQNSYSFSAHFFKYSFCDPHFVVCGPQIYPDADPQTALFVIFSFLYTDS